MGDSGNCGDLLCVKLKSCCSFYRSYINLHRDIHTYSMYMESDCAIGVIVGEGTISDVRLGILTSPIGYGSHNILFSTVHKLHLQIYCVCACLLICIRMFPQVYLYHFVVFALITTIMI